METNVLEKEKQLAAYKSITFVENGMVVGLGSGSTASYMVQELGKAVAKGLTIKGIASSEKTAQLARKVGIPLITLDKVEYLDINIDGADEFDNKLQLIKGGGGALLREKIIAHNSKLNIIIADSEKQVNKLGKFKLPVETIPFATQNIINKLSKMGLQPIQRQLEGSPFITDEKNYIVDVDISQCEDLSGLDHTLIKIPGIVETGLFLSMTDIVLMGKGQTTVILKNDDFHKLDVNLID
ncbi:ribose-5-phosphate isomerase RpiA [Maribacter sp. 2308TA10-17]|uniref:ribose-5-phosphate isomerase RpiA n=1 Tax=Maribacter sp. 2308TA10-17 TaxID=3386276 RepID=UPI0039BD260C